MRHLRLLFMVSMCVLVSASARADDGGWLDWLYRMDTKFVGVGTDFHACFGADGKFIKCEDWFTKLFPFILHRKLPEGTVFSDIRHEVNFRVAHYWKYGEGLPDAKTGSIKAWKLMGVYYCHFNREWEVGAGVGVIPFYGSDFQAFSRGIITPLSVVYGLPSAPATTLRFEASYLTHEFSGALLGHPESAFFKNGEWNFSGAVGFDVRRIAVKKKDQP
jgi:hypothetical protein